VVEEPSARPHKCKGYALSLSSPEIVQLHLPIEVGYDRQIKFYIVSHMPDPQVFSLAVQVKGQGYPILCLHGHPGSAQSMRVFTDHFSGSSKRKSQYQTITPDLRGYGKSQTHQAFEMEDHLTDLAALVDRLQLDRFMILGWSLGGILAIELALNMPDRVSGLILVATAARPRGNHPPVSWQDNLYTGIASVLNLIKPAWQWNIDTFGKRSLYRYLVQQHTPSVYQHLAVEGISAYLQTSQFAHKALWNAQVQRIHYDRLPDLAQIRCPALMLAGEGDRHITVQSSQETAQHLHNCEMRSYTDTAHLFPWEISERMLHDVDAWLEKNT